MSIGTVKRTLRVLILGPIFLIAGLGFTVTIPFAALLSWLCGTGRVKIGEEIKALATEGFRTVWDG